MIRHTVAFRFRLIGSPIPIAVGIVCCSGRCSRPRPYAIVREVALFRPLRPRAIRAMEQLHPTNAQENHICDVDLEQQKHNITIYGIRFIQI